MPTVGAGPVVHRYGLIAEPLPLNSVPANVTVVQLVRAFGIFAAETYCVPRLKFVSSDDVSSGLAASMVENTLVAASVATNLPTDFKPTASGIPDDNAFGIFGDETKFVANPVASARPSTTANDFIAPAPTLPLFNAQVASSVPRVSE